MENSIIIASVISAIGFCVVWILKGIQSSINEAKNSVDSLNIKVAAIFEKTMTHEKSIENNHDRILRLEQFVSDRAMCFDHSSRLHNVEKKVDRIEDMKK